MTSINPPMTGGRVAMVPAVKANEGSMSVNDIKNSLSLGGKPEEKRQFLQTMLERLKNDPNKDETTTNFTNLLEDFFDNALSPEGSEELGKMLGVDLDTLKDKG